MARKNGRKASKLPPLTVKPWFPFLPPGTPVEKQRQETLAFTNILLELERRKRLLNLAPPEIDRVLKPALDDPKGPIAELRHGIDKLCEVAVKEKDGTAAWHLANELLTGIEKLHRLCVHLPDTLKWFTPGLKHWPGVVDRKGKPTVHTEEALKAIKLGANTIRSRMEDAQGGSEAREWARAIIETLEYTRRYLADVCNYGEDVKTLLKERSAVTILPVPDWARRCAKLPPFAPDKATLDAWKEVGLAMLRDQCPDFHKPPNWETRAATWDGMRESRKKAVILDGILKAMDTLAGARRSKPTA
jgi:hypothetical protein